jgi:hypothetical protein
MVMMIVVLSGMKNELKLRITVRYLKLEEMLVDDGELVRDSGVNPTLELCVIVRLAAPQSACCEVVVDLSTLVSGG